MRGSKGVIPSLPEGVAGFDSPLWIRHSATLPEFEYKESPIGSLNRVWCLRAVVR